MLIGVYQKLHRAGTSIRTGSSSINCGVAHTLAQGLIDKGRWCFLYYLLVPALYGTVSLSQVNHIAMIIGEYLNFNMTGL